MRFDIIIIGGGYAGSRVACGLQDSGFRCAVITAGKSVHGSSLAEFEKSGGVVFADDQVTESRISDSVITEIRTEKLGGVWLHADSYVIATGKFFSKGLMADMNKVWEPVFGLDVQYEKNRSGWYAERFSDHQPFLDFGVTADDKCRPSIEGKRLKNLYAAGEILAGVSAAEKDGLRAVKESADKAVKEIISDSNKAQ